MNKKKKKHCMGNCKVSSNQINNVYNNITFISVFRFCIICFVYYQSFYYLGVLTAFTNRFTNIVNCCTNFYAMANLVTIKWNYKQFLTQKKSKALLLLCTIVKLL